MIPPLFDSLNRLAYYQKSGPKSLGKEWVKTFFLPTVDDAPGSIEDKIATVVQHTAFQIGHAIAKYDKGKKGDKMLMTGGGAYNKYLIEQIQHQCAGIKIVIPDKNIVEFKEALIFAFLGVLRWRTENNTLRSVTGAKMDSCGGSIFYVQT